MGMRLLQILIYPFVRRTAWARGRLAYRLLITLVTAGRPATRR